MSADRKSPIRCAIYTRKSSEEGLEQSFNSLDAQREACHAYIVSQRHEGWRPITTQYDDGGYSGGTMERPAVKRLLDDIVNGKVDVVVVYKVDRLTRSLADFAKMIEVFDAHGVSFVSVTQQFNTTSSMGRLTLNVLLSFAQFEREVTGERIRDKIAASKRKGMWMGGMVPLGYTLNDRKLVVNHEEAERVRKIYRTYLKLGCVAKLKLHLDKSGIKTKIRVSKAGRKSGGNAYSRGALYELLQHRVYLGAITHRGHSYPGQHQAIVSKDLWDRVQSRLKTNNNARRNGVSARNPSLLAGLIYDPDGNRYTPSHAVKDGKRYRYYISQAVIHHRPGSSKAPTRIPAQEVEKLILSKLQSFLAFGRGVIDALGLDTHSPATTQALVVAAQKASATLRSGSPAEVHEFVRLVITSVEVHEAAIEVRVKKSTMLKALLNSPMAKPARAQLRASGSSPDDVFELTIKASLKRFGGEIRLILEGRDTGEPAKPVSSMIKAIARAHQWYELIVQGKQEGGRSLAKRAGFDETYVSLILRCAFLAPDIVETILDGRQPLSFNLARITSPLPMDWVQQRHHLGLKE
jgi:site-specific DNA recombinase